MEWFRKYSRPGIGWSYECEAVYLLSDHSQADGQIKATHRSQPIHLQISLSLEEYHMVIWIKMLFGLESFLDCCMAIYLFVWLADTIITELHDLQPMVGPLLDP